MYIHRRTIQLPAGSSTAAAEAAAAKVTAQFKTAAYCCFSRHRYTLHSQLQLLFQLLVSGDSRYTSRVSYSGNSSKLAKLLTTGPRLPYNKLTVYRVTAYIIEMQWRETVAQIKWL